MKRTLVLVLGGVLAGGLLGCRAPGDAPTAGSGGKTAGDRPKAFADLTPTPDIYTAPPKGRYTLGVASFTEETPSPEATAARIDAEREAKDLRAKKVPAFILTRSIERGSGERVPVYYVCVGAFESTITPEARQVFDYFQGLRAKGRSKEGKIVYEGQLLSFLVLNPTAGTGGSDELSLYEMPKSARFGLQVALFQGANHKQLARDYALKLREQGNRPLIQQSETSSRVSVNPVEFPDDPVFLRLRQTFPRLEHNMLGIIVFRGIYKGATDEQRARGVVNDLLVRGYDAYAGRPMAKDPSGAGAVPMQEVHVFVIRKGNREQIEDVKRTYSDINPAEARAVEWASNVIDLTQGAWSTEVKNPVLTPVKPR